MVGVTDPGRTGDDRLEVIVGVVGRANGLRGDVSVELRTDEPEIRFALGAVVGIEGSTETLTVAATRDGAGGRLFVRFQQAADRTAAEGLRGRVLTAVVDPSERPDDPEEYYDRQLRGLRVLDAPGSRSAWSPMSSTSRPRTCSPRDRDRRAARTVVSEIVPEATRRRHLPAGRGDASET